MQQELVPPILRIPLENIHEIITPDIAALALTCKALCAAVYGSSDTGSDHFVWRSLFLQTFDDPRIRRDPETSRIARTYNFKENYQARIRASTRLKTMNATCEERKEVLSTLLAVLKTAAPFPYGSKNGAWVEKLLKSSGAANHAVWLSIDEEDWEVEEPDAEEQALRSELHVYIGLTDLSSNSFRALARSHIYDLSNYTFGNLFAPLVPLEGGGYNPDYKHLERLMTDILWNLKELVMEGDEARERFTSRPPTSLDALRPYTAPGWQEQFELKKRWEEESQQLNGDPPEPLSSDRPDTEWEPWEDWAGVEGLWDRVVSFMDHRDLARFNVSMFSPGNPGPSLNHAVFEEEDFAEITHRLSLELRITSIDRSTSTTRPKINFEGKSRTDRPGPFGSPQEQSYLTGWVEELTPGLGDIRWHMVNHIGGEPTWSSEHIQLGGVGSARGVLGTWTGAGHDLHDPAGPSWAWKTAGREALAEQIQ